MPRVINVSIPGTNPGETGEQFMYDVWLLCAEPPTMRTSDQEAADNDDDFPEQSPEEIAQMVQTDKYAVVGELW